MLMGNFQPAYFTLRGVKHAPFRADFAGADRDKVALPAGQTDISLKSDFIGVKYSGQCKLAGITRTSSRGTLHLSEELFRGFFQV